jgi:hypothetical protein
VGHEYIKRIINFGSSSEGNAFYLELQPQFGTQVNILIECGFEYNDLLKKMIEQKVDVSEIDAILISHHHKDHSASVKHFSDRGYQIYAPKTVFDVYNISNGNIVNGMDIIEILDNIEILSVPLEHYDTNQKVENYGYVISVDGEYHILYAIDTKSIPEELKFIQYDIMLIEANYVENNIKIALSDAIKNNDKGKIARYSRLENSHLSLEDLARNLDGSIFDGATPFDLSKTTNIFLLHLSSNKLTNERYYELFLTKYIEATRNKTKANPKLKVRTMLKKGGI